MKKIFLSAVLIICMFFSLTACASEKIEGRYYYAGNTLERNSDYYIEFSLDGTFEMYQETFNWWDENGQEHEICTGKYEIKREGKYKYIKFQFPDGLLKKSPSMADYVLFIRSDTILSEYTDRYLGNYIKA